MHQNLKKAKVSPMDIDSLYPNAPTSVKTCELAGKKYKVVSHYVGTKQIDSVIHNMAIKQAYAEMKISA